MTMILNHDTRALAWKAATLFDVLSYLEHYRRVFNCEERTATDLKQINGEDRTASDLKWMFVKISTLGYLCIVHFLVLILYWKVWVL